MTGPPMHINMDFIAGGLVLTVTGLACAAVLFGYTWWAPLVLGGAWLATHWLLRESAVWRDRNTDEVRAAQRARRVRLPPRRRSARGQGAAPLRPRRLDDGALRRAAARGCTTLQYQATRLREKPLAWSLLLVTVRQRRSCSGRSPPRPLDGRIDLGRVVVFAQVAVGVSAIAFGGLSWALDGAAAPVAAVLRLEPAMAARGALAASAPGAALAPRACPRARSASATSPSPTPAATGRSSKASTSRSPPDPRSPSSARTARARRRSPSSSAGSTTRRRGAIEVDGVDLRDLDVDAWRSRVTAVFQDFIRFELPLRDNVAPGGAPDDVVLAALAEAGASGLAELDTPLARGYEGGTDLSGGQWQRVALARALCAVRQGAGLVLLDEPTAQLDVRGEAEIFDRILAATRKVTTILISHRFSTVRHADRICVLEHGRVIELGTHDELMALGGRYRTMFDLQAQRFGGHRGRGRSGLRPPRLSRLPPAARPRCGGC